jgi:hypothetical protein
VATAARATEREVGDRRRRPGLRRWRDDERGLRGVAISTARTTRRVGRIRPPA